MNPTDALELLLARSFEGSTATRRLLISHYKAKSTDAELAHFAGRFLDGKEEIAQKNIKPLRRRYEEAVERQRAVTVVASNKALIAQTIAVRCVTPATATGSILLAGLSWSANCDADRILESIDQHGRAEARVLLAHQLAMYERSNPGPSIDKLFEGKPADVLAVLTSVCPVFSLPDPQERGVAEGLLLREIRAVAEGTLKLEAAEQPLDSLAASGRQVENVGKTFLTFAKRTSEAFNQVDKVQRTLQLGLSSFQDQWNKSDDVAQFAQSYLFGNQTVEGLLGAAKTNFWPTLPLASIETLVKTHEQLFTSVRGYVDASAALLDVARSLGVKKEVIEGAGKLVKAGQAAYDIASALATGNPLQAAGAVMGILGRARPDPAVQRHAQIMNKLSEIGGQIDVVIHGIEDIKKLQLETLKGLAHVQDLLFQLGENLSTKHEEVMQKLDKLHQEMSFVKKLLLDQIGLRVCDTFLSSRKTFKHKIQNSTEYEKQVEHFAASERMFDEGMNALTRVFSLDEEQGIHGCFAIQALEKPDQPGIEEWRTKIYTPILSLVTRRFASLLAPSPDALLSMFLLPARSVRSLPSLQIRDISDRAILKASLLHHMGSPLAPRTVLHATRYLLGMLPYEAYIDKEKGGHTLLSPDDVVRKGAPLNPELLRSALAIVEVTIAQQALVSGHLLLPLLRKLLFVRPDKNAEAEITAIKTILAASPLLAKNLLLYCFCFRSDGSETDSTVYAAASALSEPGSLEAILGSDCPWTLKRTVNGFEALIMGELIPIPTPDELRGGLLHYPAEFDPLLQLRARIAAELADLEFLQEREVHENLSTAFSAALYHSA